MHEERDSGHRQALTPYLIVKGGSRAIEFYRQAFGAEEIVRLDGPDGRVGHAEIRIGDSHLMLADEHPDFGALSPISVGGSPVNLHLYVDDVDRVVERAASAGAVILRPVKNEFYGDRTGMIVDPFGHRWQLATAVEAVSAEEVKARYEAATR
jgi:PhnB protein